MDIPIEFKIAFLLAMGFACFFLGGLAAGIRIERKAWTLEDVPEPMTQEEFMRIHR